MPTKVKTRAITIVRRITIEQKTCPQCGKTFEGAKVAKFCSKTCANNASYARHAEQYRAHRREVYRARRTLLRRRRKGAETYPPFGGLLRLICWRSAHIRHKGVEQKCSIETGTITIC